MITTNIRLPEDQWKALKIMAVHAGTSVSELLRRAVHQILKDRPPLNPAVGAKKTGAARKIADPFFDVVGLGAGGPEDDSIRHDRYLYRRP